MKPQIKRKIPSINLIIALYVLILIGAVVPMAKASTIELVKNAFYSRDYQTVKDLSRELLDSAMPEKTKPDKTKQTILALYSIAVNVQQDVEGADEELEEFLKNNADSAEVQYVAGQLWITLAKRASVFSKMSYYNEYVQAMTHAAILSPDNDRYQYEAAKAYGQPSIMGGDSAKQKPIVDLLTSKKSPFAPLAQMDYLQNTQDKTGSYRYVEQVSVAYANNVEVIERAAQLLWTFDKREQAGAMFIKACLLPPGVNEVYVKWREACLLGAIISQDQEKSWSKGLNAINRLLEHEISEDEETAYAISVKNELHKLTE